MIRGQAKDSVPFWVCECVAADSIHQVHVIPYTAETIWGSYGPTSGSSNSSSGVVGDLLTIDCKDTVLFRDADLQDDSTLPALVVAGLKSLFFPGNA